MDMRCFGACSSMPMWLFLMQVFIDVCNLCARSWLQSAEKEVVLPADDVDEVSSYGTGNSSEGIPEPPTIIVTDDMGEGLTTMNAAIAALGAAHAIIVEKLTSLENAVVTVQFDMTFVRDDMTGVHNAMDHIAKHVGDLRDGTPQMQKTQGEVHLDASPKQPWTGQGNVEECLMAPGAGALLVNAICLDDEGDRCDIANIEVGGHSADTHTFDNNVELHNNIASILEGGRDKEWGVERIASPIYSSPPNHQRRTNIDAEQQEDETQYMDMSCPSNQMQTPMCGPSLWKDFAASVRDWPPPCTTDHDITTTKAPRTPNAPTTTIDITTTNGREEGWGASKKAKWDWADYGHDRANTANAPELEEHEAQNVNLLLEKAMPVAASRGTDDDEPRKNTEGARKNMGHGAGRASARATKPPPMQPRYHTPVSFGNMNS